MIVVYTYDSNVGNIVPHIGYILVGREIQCSLEARYSMVVLLSVEATKPEVVEQLGIVYTHLQKTPGNGICI